MEYWRPKLKTSGLKWIPVAKPINSLLSGGVPTELITEFYGPPSSGKTNISILATVNAIRSGFKVAYLDPEGSFHLARVEQVSGDDFDKVLENITLLEPESFQHQTDLIRHVIGKGYRLIVIDPITYYYRLELDRTDPEPINQELGKQLAMLSWHARKKNAAVIVTNQIYSDFKGGYEPLAKEVLGYNAKVRVELNVENNHRTAKLVKHVFLPTGKMVRFKITSTGIE